MFKRWHRSRAASVGGGPEVEGVAGSAALEAVEGVGVGVDAEAAGGAAVRAVQGAGAALLAGVIGAGREAEQREHLGDGEGGSDGGEVDSRALSDSGLTRLGFMEVLP